MWSDTIARLPPAISALLYIIVFIIVGTLIGSNPNIAFFLTGAIIFALFFFHTKYAVYSYAAYLAFEETILQYVPGAFYLFLKYSGDMMLVLLGMAVFTKLAMRKYSVDAVKYNPINVPLACFLIVAVASILINQVPIHIAFIGMRQLLRFVALYYLIIIISSSEWDSKTIRTLFSILLVVMLIQAVLGYAQAALGPGSRLNYLLAPGRTFFYEGVRISGGLSWADSKGAYGTMLVRNTYGVCMTFFTLMLLGMAHFATEERRKYIVLLIILIPTVFFSYSRQSIYGMFLGMLAIGFIMKNRKLLLALVLSMLMFILVVSVYRIEAPAITEQARLIEKIASPFQAQYLKWSAKADRLYVLSNFGPKILQSKYVLIGTGPASFGSAVGEAFKYYEGYKKYDIGKIGPRYSFAIADTGVFALFGQFGILGFTSLMWMFASLFFFILKLHRKIDDLYFKGISLGILGMVPALLFSNVGYINLDLRQISFYFWFLSAIVLTYWGEDTVETLVAAGFRRSEK